MSSSYKKIFRSIPNSSVFLMIAPFSTNPAKQQFGATLDFNEDPLKNTGDAYTFLQDSASAFKNAFGLHIVDQIDSTHAIYYVSNPIKAPIVRSKKKRVQKHARLVALSNLNRTFVR